MATEPIWLNETYPKAILGGHRIEVAYQAVSVDYGPGPVIATFKVLCVIQHSMSGFVQYYADDLSFMDETFGTFADNLKRVLDGKAVEAVLAPVGRELVVTVKREKDLRMYIEVREWEGGGEPDNLATAGCEIGNTDIAYGWVRDLRDFSERLSMWILAN